MNILKIKGLNISRCAISVVLFALLYCIYYYCCVYCASDMEPHTQFAMNRLEHGTLFKNNFLLFLLVNVFSGFTGNIQYGYMAMSGLLAFATTCRCSIATDTFKKFNIKTTWAWICGVSLAFVFITPVFKNYAWYEGYYVPTVWHNSTILFVFPFAVLLYQRMMSLVENGVDRQDVIWMSILVALNIYIKPSFFFVYVSAYPLLLLYKYRLKKDFWIGVIPVIVGIMLLLIEYLSLFGAKESATAVADASFVYLDFKPLLSLSFWKDMMPKFVISFAFLGLFVVCYFKEIVKDVEFWTLAFMMVVAIAIYLICKEGGPRANDGNFYWQVVPTMWLCYFYILKKIVVGIKNPLSPKQRILSIIFACLYSTQVLSGIAYLTKYLLTKDYF